MIVTIFISLAAILATVAVFLVAWPLFRPRPDAEGEPVLASHGAALAIVAAVPLTAFILYFSLSDWWDASTQAQAQVHGSDGRSSLEQVASQLEERLAREKGDAEGWKLLGRTYVVMGNFPRALEAYNQAYTLTSGADTDALLGYAEARILVNEADFEGEAGQLFERALQGYDRVLGVIGAGAPVTDDREAGLRGQRIARPQGATSIDAVLQAGELLHGA